MRMTKSKSFSLFFGIELDLAKKRERNVEQIDCRFELDAVSTMCCYFSRWLLMRCYFSQIYAKHEQKHRGCRFQPFKTFVPMYLKGIVSLNFYGLWAKFVLFRGPIRPFFKKFIDT